MKTNQVLIPNGPELRREIQKETANFHPIHVSNVQNPEMAFH